MLEVLPIQTKEEQKNIAALCKVDFDADLMAYQAIVEKELCGICQFTMDQNGGRILSFASVPEKYDFEAMFVLGRATLNFIDLCGVHRAFFDAENDNETLIKAIGFRKNADGRWEMDLTDFFKEPCKHSPK